jgi:carbonic anhydrase/acetyltransferase-like protein (isoleucine patch superfamily)
MNAVIMDGAVIGESSIVAAMAFVKRIYRRAHAGRRIPRASCVS